MYETYFNSIQFNSFPSGPFWDMEESQFTLKLKFTNKLNKSNNNNTTQQIYVSLYTSTQMQHLTELHNFTKCNEFTQIQLNFFPLTETKYKN